MVFSTWSWETFNVPERIALALASKGARVLYCDMPVSRFRRAAEPLRELAPGVYRFSPSYLGARLNSVPILGNHQWAAVAKEIVAQVDALGLKDPVFVYSHVEHIAALCQRMKASGFPLVHICMDYPEPYQYELIELSDLTLAIPKAVFRELREKYGDKIGWIPQSIHLPPAKSQDSGSSAEPVELANISHPRLGYLGPIFARLNLPMLREVLIANPDWHFVYFGDQGDLRLPNAHALGWHPPETLPSYIASFDAGIMPYDCSDRKNLYCSPLKLYDYFLAGMPVAATPIFEMSEFSDLVYLGSDAVEFAAAIRSALQEPPESPKRGFRKAVAQAHSTKVLGERLEEVLGIFENRTGKIV